MQTRSSSNLKGIDVSNYQNSISMGSVAAEGIKVVILKASEGEHTKDPAFRDLYGKAKAAGLKIGAYHFLHVGGEYTVDTQVSNFCDAISDLAFDCKVAVDIEDGGYHGGTPEQVTAQILDFALKVKAKTNIPCVIYTNTDFLKTHFTAAVKALPLWIAQYGVDTPGYNGFYDTWSGFQYSESGNLGGCSAVDLDEFTPDMFLSALQPQAAPAVQPVAQPVCMKSSDVYAVSSLPCDWNATAGTDFDVRNADGSVVQGREVSNGDRLIIRNVNFDAQFAEILYPTPHCWVHGWIRNLQNLIHDRWHFKWRNGGTKEIVYGSSAGDDQIGSIDPHEYATPLFPAASRYAILYNTSKGEETKFGYVNYHGGFNF